MPTTDPSVLHGLIDQFAAVQGGPQASPERTRPVLAAIEDGGPGASDVLADAARRLSRLTPTMAVNPLVVDGPRRLRELLLAVCFELRAIEDYEPFSFPRVVLAHIAMAEPIAKGPDSKRRDAAMQARMDSYHDRKKLREFVTGLASEAATVISESRGIPDVGPLVQATLDPLMQHLSKKRSQRSWDESLQWFRHQDQELTLEPLPYLVNLSERAASDSEAIQSGIDDLLVAALLADLRAGLALTRNRTGNALVFLDHGDTLVAREFVTKLVLTRKSIAKATRPPGHVAPEDPLVLVVAGSGPLVAALNDAAPAPDDADTRSLDQLSAADLERHPWVAARLDDASEDDITRRAKEYLWDPPLAPSIVAHVVHRLTAGHRRATELVLADLDAEPKHIDDLDRLLRRRGADSSTSLEESLIAGFLAGLSPRGHVDDRQHEDLITLSAARDNDEAEQLVPLLAGSAALWPEILTSDALWSRRQGGRRCLAPLPRYLLLRELAERTEDHPASWSRVFTRLLGTVAENDRTGRLHHQLALGRLPVVADDLAGLMSTLPMAEWLTVLDATVATPDPRPDRPEPRQEASAEAAVTIEHLVDNLHTLADRSVSSPGRLVDLYLLVALGYQGIARARSDSGRTEGIRLLLERATHYQQLAARLA